MEMTKELLRQTLEELRNTIASANEEEYEDSEWYSELVWRDELDDYFENDEDDGVMNFEDRLAVDAMAYPELYPVVRDIVRGITKINEEYWDGPIDVDGEWSAGSFFAGRLALASGSEEDLQLFANHLATRDIDHEAAPFDFFGVREIFGKYSYTKKTVPVLLGLFSANSQHRSEVLLMDDCEQIIAYLKEGDNAAAFLKTLAAWKNQQEDPKCELEEMFRLFLNEGLGRDEYDESSAEIFLEICGQGKVPTPADFA